MIRPLKDYVLLEVEPAERNIGGFIVPESKVEEAIDLYSTYSDVLNSKEKRELKKLKKKQCHFIVIGSTKKSK